MSQIEKSVKKEIIEIVPDQFFNMVKTEKLILVDFYAEWCMPCRGQAEILDTENEKLYSQVPELKIVKMNVDLDGGLSSELGIEYIPNLVVIYNRRIGLMKSGVRSVEDIVNFIGKFRDDTNKLQNIPKNEQIDTLIDTIHENERKEVEKAEKKAKKSQKKKK